MLADSGSDEDHGNDGDDRQGDDAEYGDDRQGDDAEYGDEPDGDGLLKGGVLP